MTLDQLIEQLEDIRTDENGELDVRISSDGDYRIAEVSDITVDGDGKHLTIVTE